MSTRALRFVLALLITLGAGLALASLTGVASSQAAPTAADSAAVAAPTAAATSPSQEARERLEQLRSNEYFYQSYGRSDPFRSLVSGRYEKKTAGELVEIGSARLVGVIWSVDDQFALVEDGEGFGYILRVGDRVRNGQVVSIRRNALTARVTLYGITSTVVLKLENTEG